MHTCSPPLSLSQLLYTSTQPLSTPPSHSPLLSHTAGRLLVPFPRLGARSLHARRAAAASADPSAPSAQPHFTVTTPLYYVNAAPHMGSAYPTIAADALARFHRMTGKRVKFITGTDEHGEKIQLAAEKRGMTPQGERFVFVTGFHISLRKEVSCIVIDLLYVVVVGWVAGAKG